MPKSISSIRPSLTLKGLLTLGLLAAFAPSFATTTTTTISAGTVVTQTSNYWMGASGNTDTLNVTGAGAVFNASGRTINVGSGGTAILNISNGGVVIDATGNVGKEIGGSGTVTVTDLGSRWSNILLNIGGGDSSRVGTLNIKSSGKVVATGDVAVKNGGTVNLNGGSLEATGNNGAPFGDVRFETGSVLSMKVFGTTPLEQYGRLTTLGSMNFNGMLNLSFESGFTPLSGSSFSLFDFKGFSGSFGTAQDSYSHITVAGFERSKLDFSHLATDGTLRVAVTAVPEPQTYAMLLAGLGLVGFVARRRSKQQ
ncbi:FxDxF family PEP-CTERM protein [Roseateles oligotrophus]|uniref:FxDxF family PEP-CTERM protein n=1 Tax=Roseateles oligotrophus TaxID=1769250 RepID=A0ABT2YIG0_9BURK|nr:FxDxF family PEP-CTERM protein [Roseateles oligotrophus]MCV2369792.1 FxDxF family PEP-CTERM protein [Roseateles oligotrophus]